MRVPPTATRACAVALAFLACLLVPAAAPAHQGDEDRQILADAPGVPLRAATSQASAPSTAPVPRPDCGPRSRPEPGIQGRVPREEIESGRAADGYWCNLTRVGESGDVGGFRVHRYVDAQGTECAFYDTTLLFPSNVFTPGGEKTGGVAVLDMSDPARPRRTATLVTPAMVSPHESLNISVERGLLVAVAGNPAFLPGIVDVYSIKENCRRPELLASSPVGYLGHESGMAPDGRTFYATSIGTGDITAVDLTNPRAPRPIWFGRLSSHGMSLSADGRRGYLAASDGLTIVDLSEIQGRKPNPQARVVSRLSWPEKTIPQVAWPVEIDGRDYLVEVDEYSENENGSLTAHGPRVGAARIIDIEDETRPRVVSNIRLAVHNPENRDAIADDPGAQFAAQGYAAHYCNIPRRVDPGILACSMIVSGLRVFDIRDPERPREVAYHVAPPQTLSSTGSPVIDERANYAMSQPAFVPERREVWYSEGRGGFYNLRLSESAWPDPTGRGAGVPSPGGSCATTAALRSVSASRRGGGAVRLAFRRRADLPVTVEVLRVARDGRVLRPRRVARFRSGERAVTWRPRARERGFFVARFTARRGRRVADRQELLLERSASGRVVRRNARSRRRSCGALSSAQLGRPVFGGRGGASLAISARARQRARVSVAITRGGRVVRRLRARSVRAGRTVRFRLRSAGLPRGRYRVRIRATGTSRRSAVTLSALRL